MIRRIARWSAGLLLAGAVVMSCLGDTKPSGPVLQELDLSDMSSEGTYTSLLSMLGPSHWDILTSLQDAAESERVKGLLLHVGPMGGSWASALELSQALAKLRDAGKPVHCHVRDTDNVGYAFLATACDRISMTPTGHLNLVGVRAQAVYAKALLDRLGVKAELFQAGKYKGAADPLTHEDMPDTTRESLNALLDALHGHLLSVMESGRSITAQRAQRIIDGGPYTAHRAHLEGLVDDVGFDDEARQHLRNASDVDEFERLQPGPETPSGLAAVLRALTEGPTATPTHPYLALVLLEGTITSGDRTSAASAATFVPKMRKLADDKHCKALVLRIDSPGGSAMASDRMWHAVRRVAAKKPVVVSVGDMAASGGYYIASAGTHILAEPVSLVGSIGVVGGKISVAGTADKLGVRAVTLQRGRHAAWSSNLTELSDSERDALQGMIDATYRIFLKRVAQGRGLEQEAVVPMAEGRLMVAAAAEKGGLLDGSGGLLDAVALAREQGKLDEDDPLVRWPEPRGPLAELLGSELQSHLPVPPLTGALHPLLDPAAGLGALTPLLSGEPVVAGLPYSLTIE